MRNHVPIEDEQQTLGTALKKWGKGWFKDVFCSGVLTDGTTSLAVSDLRDALKIKGKSVDTPTVDGTMATYQSSGDKIAWTTPTPPIRHILNFPTSAATTSTTYVDIPDLEFTTPNDGITRFWEINVNIEHQNSNADKEHNFAITIDGVLARERGTQTDKASLSNQTSIEWLAEISPNKVVRAQFKTNANTLTATKRTMLAIGDI